MVSLDLVFCGTPQFAIPTLEKIGAAGHRVHLVVTQPDRPRGRGLEVVASPVKQAALRLELPLTQPDTIKRNDAFRAQLQAIHPDAIIVVGYGRIIPQWMIDLPRFGNLNLHASLLPKYRGAAPIQWAIARGEKTTGVTTMRIDAGLDTGDILLQREMSIDADDTSETLGPRLAAVGAELMVETLRGLQEATLRSRRQDQEQATLAPILRKEDGIVDFSRHAEEIFNRIRGFDPWPGMQTKFRGKSLRLWKAALGSEPQIAARQLHLREDRVFVGCGENTSLELLEIQMEGKKRSSAQDFLHGYRPVEGERLGE